MLSSLRRSCPLSKNNRSVKWRLLPIPSPLPDAAISVALPAIMRSWKRSNCSTLLKSAFLRLPATGGLRSCSSIERSAAVGILITRSGRMGDSGVPVQQVARIHPQSSGLDWPAKIRHVRVSVRHRNAPRKEMKTGALDAGQVAHGAPQRAADLGVDFAEQRAE